ncbi:hypothetical protein MACH26_31280 [Planctobacterium marinum]|uniref:Uncharacterized protein n=1 Tax=Planctobacterium marinum TaxID=1631968 RepID=A0AA48KSX4_9ALTE|nr:hypothetical protein MACH26_31280 [Planctobacterium marinum]
MPGLKAELRNIPELSTIKSALAAVTLPADVDKLPEATVCVPAVELVMSTCTVQLSFPPIRASEKLKLLPDAGALKLANKQVVDAAAC